MRQAYQTLLVITKHDYTRLTVTMLVENSFFHVVLVYCDVSILKEKVFLLLFADSVDPIIFKISDWLTPSFTLFTQALEALPRNVIVHNIV